jgi:predicted Fe-Mo cluster-binding NifX family protein
MDLKRIAVGTSDGVSVCEHLARSSAFIVLEAKDGQIVAGSLRQRSRAACGNHATFVELLEGCSAVLCGGIGHGAADALAAHGIEPVVTAGKHSVEEAAALYLQGKLSTTSERVCLCH